MQKCLKGIIEAVKANWKAIVPMKAAFDKNYAKNLTVPT
jgi:hypothetical protein